MNRFTFALFLLFIIIQTNAFTQDKKSSDDAIPGVAIVIFQASTQIPAFIKTFNQTRSPFDQITAFDKIGATHSIYKLYFHPAKTNATRLLRDLQEQTEVLAAQFDYPIEFRNEPNDPEYEKEWGLQRIDAPAVWKYTTGGLTARGDTIVVAILDDGFDIQHEDLNANIWQNRFEIANDGMDNDSNGFIDDVNGWSFANKSNIHSRASHGTAVAGIVGARGNNNIGVTGINWNVKIMTLSASSSVSSIIAAYEYVIEQRKRYNESNGKQGAFVVATNASFGIANRFCAQQPVWGMMYDLLGEVGVLTGAGTVNSSVNVEEVGDMPTSCTSDFIITCLNITQENNIGRNSGFGEVSIDLGAPGDNSYSTKAFNNYGSFNENSAAAPHLTGAMALLYSLKCPELAEDAINFPKQTALLIRNAIINGVQPLTALQNKTVTGGVLNILGSLEQLESKCEVKTGDLAIVKLYPNPATENVIIEYETPDFEAYTFKVFNALGQLMIQKKKTPPQFASKREEMDVQNWAAGFYVVIIEKGNQRVFQKFVVH